MNDVVSTNQAPAAFGPYSQAICAGPRLYVSGQIGVDPVSGQMPADFNAQAHQVMKNLGNILTEAGFTFNEVSKTTIFLADLGNFSALNEIYGSYFAARRPARSCIQVAGLPKGAVVEIELVAEKGPAA